MNASQKLRLALALALASSMANAASYKCKDATGNWTAAACTGNAAPPVVERKPEPPTEARIGMTAAEARTLEGLRWMHGPNKVNTTVTQHGTHEQWVYVCDYLYFDDGILTTMQHTCG